MSTEETTPSRKIFKTRSGYCELLPDRIVLSPDGEAVADPDKKPKMRLDARSAIRILAGIFLIVLSYIRRNEVGEKSWLFVVLGVFVILLGVLGFKLKGRRREILKSNVRNIKFGKSLSVLSKGYFAINFTDENGDEKTEMIMLPGSVGTSFFKFNDPLEVMESEYRVEK